MPGRIGWQLKSSRVCKMTIRIIRRPELTNRKHGITHGWNTSYVGQGEINHTVLRVSRGQRQVPHGDARSRFPIYSRYCLIRVATRARGLEEIRKSTQVARGVFFASRRVSNVSLDAIGSERCGAAGASASLSVTVRGLECADRSCAGVDSLRAFKTLASVWYVS
eukprot:4941287-Pleurochrysis_carterae.AAC.2